MLDDVGYVVVETDVFKNVRYEKATTNQPTFMQVLFSRQVFSVFGTVRFDNHLTRTYNRLGRP